VFLKSNAILSQKIKMKHIFSVSILLLAAGIIGCSNSNGPSNGVSWTIPNVGSYYVYKTIDSPYTTFDTLWVTGRGAEQGMANTITLDSAAYIAYEANGNIAGWPGEDSTWSTMPTGGGTAVDSEVDIKTDGSRYVNRMTRSYEDAETINVADSSFSAIKIHENDFISNFDPHGVIEDTASETIDYWFIPSIGYMGKGYKNGGSWWSSQELVAFKLR